MTFLHVKPKWCNNSWQKQNINWHYALNLLTKMVKNQFFVHNSFCELSRACVYSQVVYKHGHCGSFKPKKKSLWPSWAEIQKLHIAGKGVAGHTLIWAKCRTYSNSIPTNFVCYLRMKQFQLSNLPDLEVHTWS